MIKFMVKFVLIWGMLIAGITVLFLSGSVHAETQKYVRISVYKDDFENPDFQIRVPLVVLHVAKNFLPKKIRESFKEYELDLDQIIQDVEEKDLSGRILDYIDNERAKRIVIDIENIDSAKETVVQPVWNSPGGNEFRLSRFF